MATLVKKISSVLFLSLIVLFLQGIVVPVEAQIETIDATVSDDLGIAQGNLADFIVKVLNVFLGLVSIIAVVFVIIGGFQYMTAAGDTKQTENAKKTIMYAVIGLIVIGFSWAITAFVLSALGVTPAAAYISVIDRLG